METNIHIKDNVFYYNCPNCQSKINIVDKKDKEQVYSMITDISVFHNELIARANHPDGKDNPKLVKSYFKNISIELLSGSDKFYEKMNSLLPKEK